MKAHPVQDGWPTDEELPAWYEDYEEWAESRKNPIDLEKLRERLWEAARVGPTIPAGRIMNRFHLARGDNLRAVGYVVELVSEYNRVVLGHEDVYLSTMVVLKSTRNEDHPEGLPLRGYFEKWPPSPSELAELADDRRHTQSYCRTHEFKRH